VARANIFFKARYLGAEKSALKFQMPEKIFKVQRRKEIRYAIRQDYSLKIEFADPLFPDTVITKKVLDISAGGLSFLIPPEEQPVFQQGLILRNMSFVVNRRTIKLEAEIRHCSVYRLRPNKDLVKVGLQFKNIRPGDAQHIANFVFEECRKLYSRFL
jgi:c-di-GMP-binding flagellar brake protein YcgR